MQIRAADTRSCDSNDGVLRMQDLRHGFMVDADPQRPPVIHGEHRNESFLFRLLQTTSSLCLDYAPAPVAAGWGAPGWCALAVRRALRLLLLNRVVVLRYADRCAVLSEGAHSFPAR